MNRNRNNCNTKKLTKDNKYLIEKKMPVKGKTGRKSGGKNFNLKNEERYFQQKTGNPASLYFTDQQLAEDNSYVSNRTIMDTDGPIYSTSIIYPTIIAYAMNPSVGVSLWDESAKVSRNSAIQQAASKLLTAIIANTGRVQNYTKWDLIVLICQIGEFVAMTEYARRTIGLIYKWQDINRDIPKQFVEACGFIYEDLIANLDNYISELNSYINMSNQIVIPMDKIPYLRKCRDIYQKVYQDIPDEGCRNFHIMIPYSTWIMNEETLFGTELETVNVTGFHDDPANGVNGLMVQLPTGATSITNENIDQSIGRSQPHTLWTFGEFLDRVYKPMVDTLLNSATFNLIYSDLRSTKFQATYSFDFWHAEPVYKEYAAPVEYDETMLNIFHNMSIVGVPSSPNLVTYAGSGSVTHPVFTKYNNVMHDPVLDKVVYNPTIILGCSDLGAWNAAAENAGGYRNVSVYPADDGDLILDFKDYHPSLDLRVDAMAYKASQVLNPDGTTGGYSLSVKRFGSTNYILPDHYCVGRYSYVRALDKLGYRMTTSTAPEPYHPQFNNGWCHVTYDNMLKEYALGVALSTTAKVIAYWDDVTNQIENTSDYWPLLKNSILKTQFQGVTLTYFDGVSLAYRQNTTSDPVVTDHRVRHWNGFTNCNVDNWFVLPKVKLINLFRHAYQTLFTADGIMK